MPRESQQEGSSSELKILTEKVKATKTAKDIADILSSVKGTISNDEMSRLEKVAATTLALLKQAEVDRLKISINQTSQDLVLETEKQTQKEHDRHNKDVEPIYQKFDAISPGLLLEQRKTLKNLDEALAVNKAGGIISDELKSKFTLSPQDLKEQRNNWDTIDETYKVAAREKSYHQKKINELDAAHPDLDSKPKTDPLWMKKNLHQTLLDKADKKLEQVEEHYTLRKQEASGVKQGLDQSNTQNKGFWDDRATEFKSKHKVSHEDILTAKNNEDILQQRSKASNNPSKFKESLKSSISKITTDVKKLFSFSKAADGPKPGLSQSKVDLAEGTSKNISVLQRYDKYKTTQFSEDVTSKADRIREDLRRNSRPTNPGDGSHSGFGIGIARPAQTQVRG